VDVLRALCGTQSFQAITLVTTYWGSIDEATWTARERQLADSDLWAEMLANGSRTIRCDFTRTSAMAVVDSIVKRQKTFVLDFQRQIVDEGLKLDETALGMLVAEAPRNPTTSKNRKHKRRGRYAIIFRDRGEFVAKLKKRYESAGTNLGDSGNVWY